MTEKEKVSVSLSFPSCQESMFGLCLEEHEEEGWVCKLAVTGHFCRGSEEKCRHFVSSPKTQGFVVKYVPAVSYF